jgi:hypothetical protein
MDKGGGGSSSSIYSHRKFEVEKMIKGRRKWKKKLTKFRKEETIILRTR